MAKAPTTVALRWTLAFVAVLAIGLGLWQISPRLAPAPVIVALIALWLFW
jgi:hypothetical protein